MEQYTSTDELKQAFKRPKDHLKEIDRLKPWGLSEEATFKMASENLREDGASPNGEPTTVNKLVAQVRLIPAFRRESKDRLIAFARREIRRRRRIRLVRKREFKQWYSAFCRADKTMGGVTGSRSTNPEGYARRDALISDIITRRPDVRTSGHAPRSPRHAARSAASNSSDDSGGDSDGPDLPAPLPLIGGNYRNEFHNDNSHKHENNNLIDLLNRLTLGCAGLLAAVVMSLLLTGCSR